MFLHGSTAFTPSGPGSFTTRHHTRPVINSLFPRRRKYGATKAVYDMASAKLAINGLFPDGVNGLLPFSLTILQAPNWP